MHAQSREALFLLRISTIFPLLSSWGVRPAPSSGAIKHCRSARSPSSRGRLSLNLTTGPATKHQKGKPGKGSPRLEKIKKRKSKLGLYGVQGLASSRRTGDAESLHHQMGDMSIYCVVFANLSAVVGAFCPSPREAWNSGWGLLVSSALGGDRSVDLGVRRGFLASCRQCRKALSIVFPWLWC